MTKSKATTTKSTSRSKLTTPSKCPPILNGPVVRNRSVGGKTPFVADLTPASRGTVRDAKHVKTGVDFLCTADKRMKGLIEIVGPFRITMQNEMNPFESLCESIVYQQLTGKAAATIYGRFKELFGSNVSNACPSPKQVLQATDEQLRSAGLSRAKVAALKDLAEKTLEGVVPDLEELHSMSDDEIIQRLTCVRGVGRWTVEMLLIFRMGRSDILPVNDYGIRKGFALVYHKGKMKEELPAPRDLAEFGERWSPYKTISSWYLWRALEHKDEF